MARKTNAAALDETLRVLEQTKQIEAADAAQVQALRSMAAALDEDPTKAALWREYLAALSEVRRSDDNANSALADALEKIRSGAPMGDAPQA